MRTFKKLNIQTSKTENFLGHPIKESKNESFVLPVIVWRLYVVLMAVTQSEGNVA